VKNIKTLILIILVISPFLEPNTSVYAADPNMSLPADFRAFSPSSPWNTPIATYPKVDPDSDIMIRNLKNTSRKLKGNITSWSVPLFVINENNTPKKNIRSLRNSQNFNPLVDPENKGIVIGIPIPNNVWPDPKSDGHMLLIDPKTRKSWDFSKVKRQPDGSWKASMVFTWDLNGPGYVKPFSGDYWWTLGARGSGMPLVGGLIRPEEIAAGEIKHALVAATPVNRKSLSNKVRWQLCLPASRTDGEGIGKQYIPEGARLQLDPALDLNKLELSPATKIVARALQKYGVFIGDNSEDFNLYFQNMGSDGGKWKHYNLFDDLENIPVEKFRVLKCTRAEKK
jgi:hypothetical protein